MPEDNSLEKEIVDIAENAAKGKVQEMIQPVEFPDIQKVEVVNDTETDLQPISDLLQSILSVLKVEGKEVDTSKIENKLQGILDAVSKEVEEKEDIDYTDILDAIKLAIPASLDLDEFFERLKETLDEKLDITANFKEALKGFHSSGWLPVVTAVETYADNRLKHAIDIIYDTYGDTVSVNAKKKDLRKWGRNAAVGTARATIMTLPTGVTDETLLTEDVALSVSSSSGSDTTQTVSLLEGHTSTGTNLSFASVNPAVTLTGQTAASLGVSRTRLTRARLSLPAVGDIYFYETGTTLSAGVPTDTSKVHMMIPAGEIQTQKASTAISSGDYWIITGAKAGVLSKTSAWAQVRIEIKPWTTTTNSWYPITEWIAVSDASGTVSLFDSDDPYLIIPKNHDVRLSAIANTAGIDVTGGIIGYLAIVI